ncbi:BTB/POZ domain-containing protein 9-like protein, partial [Leptotrombidium deliense]
MEVSNEETFFPKVLLNRIYGNPKYEDAVFRFEGSVVKANKLVLSMLSEYFAEMFYSETKRKIVKLGNGGEMHKKCIKLVLEFIHKGFINMDDLRDDEVIALYSTSQKLDFKELTDVVLHELKNIEVTLENVGKMYEVSKKSNLDWLQSKCLSFVETNSELVVVSHEFSNFPEDLVLEIVKSDTFYVPSELQLFLAVHSWSQNHQNKIVTNILNYIRLNQISAKDFAKHIIRTGLISHDAFFDASVDEDMKARRKVEQSPIIIPRQTAMRSTNNSAKVESCLATDAMSKLLLEDRLSDVIFEFEDGDTISGYTVFLSAACSKFVEFSKEDTEVVEREMFGENVHLFQM